MNVLGGKVLRVDLSSREVGLESYEKYAEWIGGQGVNQYILFNELPSGISPYDPSNVIAIGTGALVGTSAPGACRANIDTLNPYTGGIGSSNVGGNFARELRFAGINNIVIKGKGDELVYLCIDEERVDIIDASHLRNKTISQTAEILHREVGDQFKLMIIGPAGENLARSACVIVDGARAAGRCGIGAVMGSKNLKAIAVRGTGAVEPAHAAQFDGLVKECLDKITPTSYAKGLNRYGVYFREPWEIESPYRNFSGEIPSVEKKRRILPDEFLPYMVATKTCGSCPIRCWKVYRVMEGGESLVSEALQVNSIHNFAARLDLFDPEAILKAHAMCNDLGLDEDNASGAIAWAFECYEKGLITAKETDGLQLQWGNEEAVYELLGGMAYRRGFGDQLAEGCRRASEKLPGTRDCCIEVKGQELFEVLWACPAWVLGTVVSARGGTHTRGAVITERLRDVSGLLCQRLFGIPSVGDKASYEDKEHLVFFFEKLQALSNSLGMCYFMHGLCAANMLLPEDYARLYSTAIGQIIDSDRMMWLGERIFNLEKCFNVLHTGWTREDDMPPKRFTAQPLDGRFAIDLQSWEEMLDRYYALHGWDKGTGKPLKETLDRLDLGAIRRKLEENGKLSF
jgi:aldehyde:ferredoxin oxidoreductase